MKTRQLQNIVKWNDNLTTSILMKIKPEKQKIRQLTGSLAKSGQSAKLRVPVSFVAKTKRLLFFWIKLAKPPAVLLTTVLG